MTAGRPAAAIVLAAGGGTRMKSVTSKLLHEIGGRSLVGHALFAVAGLEPEHTAVVVRAHSDQVRPHVAALAPDAVIVDQDDVYGTGRAVWCGLKALPDAARRGVVVVTYGDVPLLTGETLRGLVDQHGRDHNAITALTAFVDDPTGYGRILRAGTGGVMGIVEDRDATPEQRGITEINSGIYAFNGDVLSDALEHLTPDNSQGEWYLTDVLGIAARSGHRVGALVTDDVWQTEGVNDRTQLATLRRVLNDRITKRWMLDGVTVVDPATTWIDVDVTLGPDVVLEPNTQLRGRTSVGAGSSIGPDTTLTDCEIGIDTLVVRTHGVGAIVGAGVLVGPYASLRPGTVLGDRSKIGTFVETKNAHVGAGAKVPHLSYAGDVTIGEGTNIGAGVIFANYDGIIKSHSTVGRHVFVGSDSVVVAPRDIADGAYIAAGSTVVSDVAAGELAVGRGKQRNIPGWVARKRAGTKTHRAALDAKAGQTGSPAGGPPEDAATPSTDAAAPEGQEPTP
jgi:bifunctional UDP-N-acetylglucosamine pyrophosphorylase/glucosamine-1-phosphate N-acetyltransferase